MKCKWVRDMNLDDNILLSNYPVDYTVKDQGCCEIELFFGQFTYHYFLLFFFYLINHLILT